MIKRIPVLGALLFTSLTILTGCGGNSIESDAKKLAEIICKSKRISQKAASSDLSVVAEATKLEAELISLNKEMKEKYPKDSENEKKLEEAFLKELGDCK
jgi:hypothetical protein